MMENTMVNNTHGASVDERVLLFEVDEGSYAVPLSSVAAIHPRGKISVHTLGGRTHKLRRFVVHGTSPALLLDLRHALEVEPLGGEVPPRDSVLIVRSGNLLLALTVDACVGLRVPDLGSHEPIPSPVLRDGGLPVAHVVDVEGCTTILLDPTRLLDREQRSLATAAYDDAALFVGRLQRSEALWREICCAPTATAVRSFGRLCRRNGRPRAATAAREVARFLEGVAAEAAPVAGYDGTVDSRFLGELLNLAAAEKTGELVVVLGSGGGMGHVVFSDGRLIEASTDGELGAPALKRMLGNGRVSFQFVELSVGDRAQQFEQGTVASVLVALESLAEVQRPARPARSGVH